MHGIRPSNLSGTKTTANSFLLNLHGEPPPLLITNGNEPQVSTVEKAASKPSDDTQIRGGHPRGDADTEGVSGSRTATQRPRSPLFRRC